MHNHSDGGSDLVVSLDAFKVTKHPAMPMPWEVHALVPWARDMMTTGATAVIMYENSGEVIGGADGNTLGLKFERRSDALAFLRELEGERS